MTVLVYLLEDDDEVAAIIRRTLDRDRMRVERFRRIAEFERALDRRAPDVCLVDLGLPDGDGLSLVSERLRGRRIPTIIVTGRAGVTDFVVGLELGADDYVVKPFEPRVLLARVRALVRRSTPEPAVAAQSFAHFGEWTADLEGCALTHADGRRLPLSAAEASLLEAFLRAPGRVLSRAQLLDLANPRERDPFDRTMDARISRLRRKLDDDPKSPRIIRTVYGAGYVFSQAVEWTQNA